MRNWSGSDIGIAFVAIVLAGIMVFAFVQGIRTCEFGC